MFLFSRVLFEQNFKLGSWNFIESGHGKGAPDGVRGAIKRLANRLMAQGNDIPDGITLFNVLQQNTTMSLYYISTQDIDLFQQKLNENVKCIKGIMKIHQCHVNKEDRKSLSTKMLSCFCAPEECYSCVTVFQTKSIHFWIVRKLVFLRYYWVTLRLNMQKVMDKVSAYFGDGVQGEAENRGMNIRAGEYCTFLYEGSLYAGLIKAVDFKSQKCWEQSICVAGS